MRKPWARDRSEAADWKHLERDRFRALWEALPALTVLAALPGWGKTSWMQQCWVQQQLLGVKTRWITDRAELDAFVAERSFADEVVFIDDVVIAASDAAWPLLLERSRARTRVVLGTIDVPDPTMTRSGVLVLDERDLAFNEREVDALIAMNEVVPRADEREVLARRLRGCPQLVRRQLVRARARRADPVSANITFAFERAVMDAALHLVPLYAEAGSVFIALLQRAAAFRRFSLDLVEDAVPVSARHVLHAQFDRLRALPLGAFDTDDETGREDYVWTSPAWAEISDGSRRNRDDMLRNAMQCSIASGRTTIALFYLLELGDLAAADALVFEHFRRFLSLTDGVTQEALLALTADTLGAWPNLALLAADMRIRARGANAQSVRDAEACLKAMPLHGGDPFMRFRLLCRRSMAAAIAGRRRIALEHVERIADALDVQAGSPVLREADQTRAAADRVAADLYLAFWAAVQIDRHDLALEFAHMMRAYSDPAVILTRVDLRTILTEEDFAGLRSCDPQGAPPIDLAFSNAAPLVLIEDGEDGAAVERAHELSVRVRPAHSRSSPDALVLLTHALAASAVVAPGQVEGLVSLSRAFWDDGRESTFVRFGAVLAHLGAGRLAEAKALIDGPPTLDWFTGVSGALVALASGEPAKALGLMERTRPRTSAPRWVMVSEVLTVAALLRLSLQAAAIVRVAGMWQRCPAPRLLRFALRFVAAEDVAALAECGDLPEGVRDVLAVSAGDRRLLTDPERQRISAAEREILLLLRHGMSNAAIAEQRGVTHNTIRTQLRLLYRKLGVEDRSAAVALAERADLFEER